MDIWNLQKENDISLTAFGLRPSYFVIETIDGRLHIAIGYLSHFSDTIEDRNILRFKRCLEYTYNTVPVDTSKVEKWLNITDKEFNVFKY